MQSNRCLYVCLSTLGWIKMKLGMQVGLGPGHIVLDGDPHPPKAAAAPPLFSAHAYCGHGRQSQLLLSSCTNGLQKSTFHIFFHTLIYLQFRSSVIHVTVS